MQNARPRSARLFYLISVIALQTMLCQSQSNTAVNGKASTQHWLFPKMRSSRVKIVTDEKLCGRLTLASSWHRLSVNVTAPFEVLPELRPRECV